MLATYTNNWPHELLAGNQATPADPLDDIETTLSMKAAGKYAFTVIALFVVQVLLGDLTRKK